MLVANKMLAANEVSSVKGGNELIKKYRKLSKTRKLSKSQKLVKSKKKLSKSGNLPNFDIKENGPNFLTPHAKIAFNYLQLAFTKAPIFWHFDLECHIWIETDTWGYVIGDMLNQLTSETRLDGVITKTNLGQWHPIAFFLRKIIPVETWYKIHNGKLLAIIKAFKTWRHY